jgi:hypothetical protein
VVAGSNDVDAGGEQVFGGLWRKPPAAGGVLAIRDNEVNVPLAADFREYGSYGSPA